MGRIVVVGGGWAGCAAAVSARKAGEEVELLERTDMLLGTGLVGGIIRNNGRFTAAEEMIEMGGGDLFKICDENSRHRNINFPGHMHATLYDIGKIHGAVLSFLKQAGVKIHFRCRVSKINMENEIINFVEDQKGNKFNGDVFIDATGTAGPTNNCVKYGNGCAMCVIRCPSFGGRVSLAALAGVEEYVGKRADGSPGVMSGSCKLFKESLSKEIQSQLDKEGVVIIPIPEEFTEDKLGIKACQQYAIKEFKENIILLDTGHAKLMSPYMSLETLQKIPGFESARYEDPYAGSLGNSMRYFSITPRDNYLMVRGLKNLFCCGEKAGVLGHTEAIVTGTLAGYNAARLALEEELLELPGTLTVGDIISFAGNEYDSGELTGKYTFSGSVYFERMKRLGLYTTDIESIAERVGKSGLKDVFRGGR